MAHYPVLLKEVLQYVGAEKGESFIDATVGAGGHSKAIIEANSRAHVLGLDLDGESLKRLEDKFTQSKFGQRVTLVHSNYKNVARAAAEQGLEKVSGIILDLGFSSLQLGDPERGLSFQAAGPLDMRYDRNQKLTAGEIVNKYPETKLAEIFKNYGEENFSRRIAHAIVRQREVSDYSATDEVFRVIQKALPAPVKHKAPDSARRIFQALRIEVNAELENLRKALPDMFQLLEIEGRLVVISFHSLEDRIVKNFFNELAKGCICPPDFPECVCGRKPLAKILTKKPITASEKELAENPRSKPAKLRAIEKITEN
jgi:16S rRNA (cytosine1402-N4)-methyltransferase